MTPEKLKIWKVWESDHAIVGRLFHHDQTQPEIFHDLIDEPIIFDLIIENLSEARTLLEAAKKGGKTALGIKSADIAIKTLIEIKKILSTRNLEKAETIRIDVDEQQELINESKTIEKLLKEKDGSEIHKEEIHKRVLTILNYLKKMRGDPFTQ